VVLERLPPLAQVDLLLETDVLISYHGSGLGGGHVWMPPGGVVVEIMPHKFDYCVVATCVAHSGKAHFLVTTRQPHGWQGGGSLGDGMPRLGGRLVSARSTCRRPCTPCSALLLRFQRRSHRARPYKLRLRTCARNLSAEGARILLARRVDSLAKAKPSSLGEENWDSTSRPPRDLRSRLTTCDPTLL
jgi:hypothetical protein